MLDARISVHDVMPHTLPYVADLLQLLSLHGFDRVRLLVVPGVDWTSSQVKVLRSWSEAGHALAAHGWHHKASHISGWRHRLHAAVVSRDVAEHLALDAQQIVALMRRAAEWFERQGLKRPSVYVPPAWALGQISPSELKATGFQKVEITQGEWLVETNTLERQPLLGFEADTQFRARALRLWNQAQWAIAAATAKPLRIAIHPQDLQLRLGSDLRAVLIRLSDQRAVA